MRVRITVYHFRDIFIELLANHICNIFCIVTIKIGIARQACDSTNIRKNARNAKRLKDFIHIAHLLKFLATNAIAKIPNTWETLRKN